MPLVRTLGRAALAAACGVAGGSLTGGGFRTFVRLVDPDWAKPGVLSGNLTPTVTILGDLNYRYDPDPADPLTFTTWDGKRFVLDKPFLTDGGSIPRIFWSYPGLDPWTYILGFLFHDRFYLDHHCTAGFGLGWAAANTLLGQVIYTSQLRGLAPADWRPIEAITAGVSTPIALNVWNAPWTPAACLVALPG